MESILIPWKPFTLNSWSAAAASASSTEVLRGRPRGRVCFALLFISLRLRRPERSAEMSARSYGIAQLVQSSSSLLAPCMLSKNVEDFLLHITARQALWVVHRFIEPLKKDIVQRGQTTNMAMRRGPTVIVVKHAN